MLRFISLVLYYGLFRYLPSSNFPYIGSLFRFLRYSVCRFIFKSCGKNVNIERMASFGRGGEVVIGDRSGIGINCTIPPNTQIGNNVMMGPNCFIFSSGHCFDRLDIPMIDQGSLPAQKVIIEDDVWIGRGCVIMPGRVIARGSILATGTILTKNFPEYSIIGGVPGKLIKSRLTSK